MEQLKWTTPIKNENKHDGITMKSPVMYKTPVKQHDSISTHATYQNNISCFSVLPSHITPPSGLTKFMARNPFETDLTNRLHLSVISPTVFSKVSNSAQQSPDFAWSVDELAMIQPARIEEFPEQQLHCIDQETEVKAQAAIDRFFKENKIIPSPWEVKKKDNRIKTDTPTRASSNMSAVSSKLKKDGWSQTVLSLPPDLPSHVEEVLKPYLTFTQEQNSESDDSNSSNNSLRRKLFCNHDEYLEKEENFSDSVTSVKLNGSLILSSSHPQNGMLVDGVPFKPSQDLDNHLDTSEVTLDNLSSPNISPIQKRANNMSCESVKSRNCSAARLDFVTEMSVDQSSREDNEYSNDISADVSLDNIKAPAAEYEIHKFLNFDNNSECAQINNSPGTKIVAKSSTYIGKNYETEDIDFSSKDRNDIYTFTKLGMSDQQSVSNSVQDTGYQTYSMSSTTNITDSCNNTPVKQKICYSERVLLTDDVQSTDWNENMKNIFCSTPSKSSSNGNHPTTMNRHCVSDKHEKLYILEVFVSHVSLYPEKLHGIDASSLGVDMQFPDMPLFRIFQTSFTLTKPDRNKESTREAKFRNVYFNAGKVYIFIRVPSELVEKLRTRPILLDVYKIKEILICPEEVKKHPLGRTKIPMSGCLCDYVMMTSNDYKHLPKSYQIDNTFGLVDDDEKPSGYINIFLRLTCFGTYTTNAYSIFEQKMLFKNLGSFNEFLCTKVPYDDEDDRRAAEASSRFCSPYKEFEKSELDTPPRPIHIAGLVFVCRELSRRDSYPPEVIPLNYPPKIPIIDVEEQEFNVDKARRKGFDDITPVRPEFLIEKQEFWEATGCKNASCVGSICIGKKCC
ncbi:aurora kinase A activator-like protein bora [Augochlora pura]